MITSEKLSLGNRHWEFWAEGWLGAVVCHSEGVKSMEAIYVRNRWA